MSMPQSLPLPPVLLAVEVEWFWFLLGDDDDDDDDDDAAAAAEALPTMGAGIILFVWFIAAILLVA